MEDLDFIQAAGNIKVQQVDDTPREQIPPEVHEPSQEASNDELLFASSLAEASIYKKPSIITGIQTVEHAEGKRNTITPKHPKASQGKRMVKSGSTRSVGPVLSNEGATEDSASYSVTPTDNPSLQGRSRGRGRGKGRKFKDSMIK